MHAFILKIIPIVLTFFLGIALKKMRILKKEDGDLFLKLVLSVTLPALTILSLLNLTLTWSLLYIPLIAQLVIFVTYAISFGIGKVLRLPNPTLGTFLVGSMIMNTSFSLPFFMAAFGQQGFALASLFDIGNSFLIFTFIYYQAIKYGTHSDSDKINWGKFLRLPPLWGLIIGFVIRLLQIPIPELPRQFLSLVGNPTIPLIMLSLGLYFEPQLKNMGRAVIVLALRMGGGLLLGIGFSYLFGLEGMTRTIVIASSAAPVGFNTLIFANMEGLDKEFAATIVSFGILLAIVYLPLVIYLFS